MSAKPASRELKCPFIGSLWMRTAPTLALAAGCGHRRYALDGGDHARRAAARLHGVLCLDSAAKHHGWKLKHQPNEPAVAVPRNRNVTAAQRQGVRVLYLDLPAHERQLTATSPIRTVLDCAARLPFDKALTIADSAVRAGDVTRAELVEAAAEAPARYRARCLGVARAADGRADNPFESVVRAIALDIPGLDLRPQQWIGERRADLVDARLRLVVEAESFEFHGKRKALKRDCERYNEFALGGWVVVRFAWEHVMFEPDYVARVLSQLGDTLSGRAA
ncbi:MAG TPA: type IV toxin-antitoxin system AbiEi family antitoxin [Nocardioidaceae bacterium]|nr:type IV toxin-antitoxin system AbiEi family antitoxin [Nocardioidaceae bacterium]